MRLARWAPAALALAGAGVLPAWLASSERPGTVRADPAHPVVFFDDGAWARALAKAGGTAPQPMPGVRAVIVPHHWLAGDLIVRAFRDLAATGPFHRIVLIGPNHSGIGGAAVATSAAAWATPFGRVTADEAAVHRLAAEDLAEIQPGVLTYEHSIAGLMPPLARFLPRARVVPLAVAARRTLAESTRLGEALALLSGPGTVIVASVDFSHYLSAGEAVARDRETLDALSAMDSRRVLLFGNEHMDSPPTIAAVFETMRRLGATRFVLRDNTNSSRHNGSQVPPVTSYVYGLYR